MQLLRCRVEPKGASHVFIVHGSECRKTAASTCTFDPRQSTTRKGMMYVIDVEAAMGTDWKVGNHSSRVMHVCVLLISCLLCACRSCLCAFSDLVMVDIH